MAKQGKNTHLEHLEDEIINRGVEGGRDAIKILKYMGRFLSGQSTGSVQVTTKFDGAPAIVCGIDPADGQFFVGTKSVFAQDAKVCKTQQDIQKWYSGELAAKLSASLTYLPSCNIEGVLQGDLMFTNDKSTRQIENESFITFKPNTITYAVNPDTPMGRKIKSAQLGIVFHTKYTGPSLPEMTASFNVLTSDFKDSSTVWAERSTFNNIGGVANFSGPEKAKYESAIRRAEGSLVQTRSILNQIQSGKKTLAIDTELKKFFNNYVKAGRPVPSVNQAYNDFMVHMGGEYNKVISKYKTLPPQETKTTQFVETVMFIDANKQQFKMLIATYMNIQVAKMMLVDKMNRVQSMRTFVNRGDYMEATTPEGFVAIVGRTATKLIDRLEFSRLNFTIPKQFGGR